MISKRLGGYGILETTYADIPPARDAHVNCAMEYLFHWLIEHRFRRLPTWDEFWQELRGRLSRYWYDPMMRRCAKTEVKGPKRNGRVWLPGEDEIERTAAFLTG
jgi:hypothetical protein